jgi:hypothetical protein
MQRIPTAVALIVMGSTLAVAQVANPPCNRRMIVSADSLRHIAQRLHPESADSAKGRAFVTVGLVFDAQCRLLHHAVGRRANPASADSVLARLIPEAAGLRYVTSGFVELPVLGTLDSLQLRLARAEHVDFGAPWIVWGVQRSAARH